MNDYRKLLKSSKFNYLWVSQILSQVTVNMMNFLLLTKLFSVTGSSIATSLLWVAYALPAIFFGPIGAASVDLINKRKMLMATNLLQALSVFGFFLFHEQSIFLLYVVVLAYSFFNQFYVPAETSSLVAVVDKKQLASANSLFFITQQGALILGFGFGGVIEKLLGFKGSLILCAVFLFIAFISVSFLTDIKEKDKIPESFEKLITKFFGSIVEGYQFIKNNKNVLYPLVLLLILQIDLAVIFANLPLIGTQVLRVAAGYTGVLVIIPAGVGAFIGSFWVPKLLHANYRKKNIIESGLILAGLGMITLALGVPFLPFFNRLIFSFLILILIGMGYILASIPTLTYLQEVTPADIRGRVFGNMWFLVTIITLFPVIFSGLLTEFLGIRFVLFLIGAVSLGLFTYIYKSGYDLIQKHF
jgi:MFS family permease